MITTQSKTKQGFHIAFVAISAILLFTGCSTKISTIQESYNGIDIKLDDKKVKSYYLYSARSGKLSTSTSHQGMLKFRLPRYVSKSQCLYIKDNKSNIIDLQGNDKGGFRLTLPEKYRGVSQKIADVESSLRGLRVKMNGYRENYLEDKRNIQHNRAYQDGSCVVPPQATLPREPVMQKCSSEVECRRDAQRLCLIKVGGSELCGRMAEEKGYSSTQSAAICSAAMAESLGEKYDEDSAITDTLVGAIDDMGDAGLEKGGFFGTLFGGAAKLMAYSAKISQLESCQESFMQTYYAPHQTWAYKVAEIKSEPSELYSHCQDTMSHMQEQMSSYQNYKQRIADAQKLLTKYRVEKRKIESLRLPVSERCK